MKNVDFGEEFIREPVQSTRIIQCVFSINRFRASSEKNSLLVVPSGEKEDFVWSMGC